MNRECRIQLHDSMMDIVTKMSEGNMGAITCLMEMIKKDDWYAGVHGVLMILNFDSMGLYGSKLYMLWNDCCDRDLIQLVDFKLVTKSTANKLIPIAFVWLFT